TYPGFLNVIDDYGISKSAKISKYYAGLCYHQLGDHEAAVNLLNKFKTDDLLVGAAKYSTLGDAYVEMGDMNKAISAYKSGIEKYENNSSSPIMLKKLGLVYEELAQLDDALEAYKVIESNYPGTAEGKEIKKYIGRVESKMAL
ncbi:MAG: tetratricopeptide repeat protein, partial [Bacteroidales bacterium]|nr:tetratricopeptide repeat protein [Bacteroidales bacterium]